MGLMRTSRSDAPVAEIVLTGLPPSLWTAYHQRRGGHGKCLTSKAAEWKRGAVYEARGAYHGHPLNGRLDVEVTFKVRSRGRWDIDNRYKLLLDALTEAGVWADDSRIDSLMGVVEIDGRRKSPETVVLVRVVS